MPKDALERKGEESRKVVVGAPNVLGFVPKEGEVEPKAPKPGGVDEVEDPKVPKRGDVFAVKVVVLLEPDEVEFEETFPLKLNVVAVLAVVGEVANVVAV